MVSSSNKLDRRLVSVPVSVDFLIDAMRQGHIHNERIECVEGVPADSVYVGAHHDMLADSVYLVFYHPSFESIPDGTMLPVKHARLHYRSSHFLNLVANNVPAMTRALVESLDDTQINTLWKILVLQGSKLPEGAKAGPLAEEFAAHLSIRIQGGGGDDVHD